MPIAKDAPIVEIAEAVAETVTNPTPEQIITDVELIISLIKQLRAALANTHPSILAVVKALL